MALFIFFHATFLWYLHLYNVFVKLKIMKIRKVNLLIIAVLAVFISCNDDDKVDGPFNAVVLRAGNCGVDDNISSATDYLIELNEDFVQFPVENNTIYVAENLPEEFKVEGLEINVAFRDLTDDEVVICPDVEGLEVFPFIYIETAA